MMQRLYLFGLVTLIGMLAAGCAGGGSLTRGPATAASAPLPSPTSAGERPDSIGASTIAPMESGPPAVFSMTPTSVKGPTPAGAPMAPISIEGPNPQPAPGATARRPLINDASPIPPTLPQAQSGGATPEASPGPSSVRRRRTGPPAGGAESAFGYVQDLAEKLGSRESATEEERAAADYLLSRFEEFGYTPKLQEFNVESLSRELSSLILDESPAQESGEEIEVVPLSRSATGVAFGPLVFVGLAKNEDIPEEGLRGKIALVERGLITFEDKVNRVDEAGAAGAVIYNNRPGGFQGTLFNPSSIPVLSISQEEGKRIQELLTTGEVQATVTVQKQTNPSRNVIAEKPGTGQGVVVLGAHYDTVPNVAGANDNASGTGVLLALAKAAAGGSQSSFPFTLRFIAFGSEETGLRGSRHYVNSLSEEERGQIRAMLNLDSLGSGEELRVSGADELTTRVVDTAAREGIPLSRSGGLLGGSSSDHASFDRAGIPVIFFFSRDSSRIHSPEDTIEFVNPELLAGAVRLAEALLESPELILEESG